MLILHYPYYSWGYPLLDLYTFYYVNEDKIFQVSTVPASYENIKIKKEPELAGRFKMLRDKGLRIKDYHKYTRNKMKKKDYCVRKALIDIQRVSSYSTDKNKRQCASSCNCSFCKRKRLDTERGLKERLASIEREATQNRRQRELSEYDKTLRLLHLMNGPNK